MGMNCYISVADVITRLCTVRSNAMEGCRHTTTSKKAQRDVELLGTFSPAKKVGKKLLHKLARDYNRFLPESMKFR